METQSKARRLQLKSSAALICGAFAGLAVDITLFPMDTLKTRLQSERGLFRSGGFKKIYSGVPSVLVGSAPGSALFFATYEGSKRYLLPLVPYPTIAHMMGASIGEIIACLVRVPTEVVKQRAQAYPNRTSGFVVSNIRKKEGIRGFYRGYWSTIVREIPFSFIQFPIWEYLKVQLWSYLDRPTSPPEAALCGSVAGMIAGGITTPLDVAKTRIMLAEKLHGHSEGKVLPVLVDIWNAQGLRGIYAGVTPRIGWLGAGGFIFFGAYELAKSAVLPMFTTDEHFELELETTGYYLNLETKIKNLAKRYEHNLSLDKPKNFEEACKAKNNENERLPNILLESYRSSLK